MIRVRLVFQAKYGKAADLVAAMKTYSGANMPEDVPAPSNIRLLTDLSGPFDTVVQELDFESFEAWQKSLAAMAAHPQARAMLEPSRELIAGGYKEFYTIEA
jgi:hypothetical protein